MGNPFKAAKNLAKDLTRPFRPKPAKVTHHTTSVTNPYNDSWIRENFQQSQNQFAQGASQLNELTKFMNERRAALAKPQTVSIGGQNIRQDQLGSYLQNQINTRASDLNRQLAEYQTGVDQSLGQLGQQGSAARQKLMSTYDARLADIMSAAGQQDARLSALGSATGARLSALGSATGANMEAIRAQQEALAAQGERARASEAALQAQMAHEADINRAAQEQNQLTAGVKADLKPANRYRYGTAGSFNRAGLRISSLNI